MSSILKALKKLEDDKAAQKKCPHKIDSEILYSSVPERISSFKLIVFALFLFACGGGATYIYMKHNQEEHYTEKAKGSLAPTVALSSSLPISVEVPVERIVPETIIAAGPETAKQKQAMSQDTTLSHAPVRPLSRQSHVAPVQASNVQPPKQFIEKNQPAIAGKQNVANKHSASALKIPVLKVNGIVFHDGLDSVAVVNGAPVSTGSLIEGVKVEEIQRDHVLFNYGGEKFIVYLGKSN